MILTDFTSRGNLMLQEVVATAIPVFTSGFEMVPGLIKTGPKLQNLNIDPFAGELCRWTEFWEQLDLTLTQNSEIYVCGKL